MIPWNLTPHSRSYWANPATMLVDDIPGEIMLHPNLWGTLRIP